MRTDTYSTDRMAPSVEDPPEIIDPDFEGYTVAEVAATLRMPVSTLYRQVKAGQFPAVQIGRYWRITRRQLDAHLGADRRGKAGEEGT